MGTIELVLWRGYDPTLPHTRKPGFDPLGGEGVRFAPGRWNPVIPDGRIVYASEHPALVLCELLAHDETLERLVLLEFHLRAPGLSRYTREEVGEWLVRGDVEATQALGERWYRSGEAPVLAVPSALLPLSTNYLIRPDAHGVELKVLRIEEVRVDERLRCG